MPGHLGGADPPLGVPHQQPRDQVLGLGGDVAPLGLREHELSILVKDIENLTAASHCQGPYLDAVEEAALTLVAESSLVPAAALAAGAGEGRVPAKENVDHHPKALEVAPLIVNQILIAVLDDTTSEVMYFQDGSQIKAACRARITSLAQSEPNY